MKSLLHFCKFLLHLEAPVSQVTEKELALLLRYSHQAMMIVEIGCFEGKTSASLAENSSGVIYTIDPFLKGRLGICYGEWIAKIYCKRKGLKNVNFIRGYSYGVAGEFQQPIDFLFIDGDHSYEAIKRDWEDWLPKVKNNGIIAVHDCRQAINSPDYLGTMQFYDQDISKIKGINELRSIDSLSVFRVSQ